jgi:hypothetical protein
MGGGSNIPNEDKPSQNSVVMFSLPERVGALAKALNVFEVFTKKTCCKAGFTPVKSVR